MKFWTFLVLTLLITANSISQTTQSNEYVSIKGKKFELNGQPFFPLTINYGVDIVHDNNNNLFIAPHNGYKDPIGYEGTNQATCFQSVVNDLIAIKNLGFNSVRLVGLGFGASKPWYETNYSTYPATVSYDINLNNALMTPTFPPYTELFGLIQQVLDAAEQADIKIELLSGSKNIDTGSLLTLYTNYLSALSAHFADNPVLFSYDFVNEPLYFGSGSNTKTQVCDIVESWNSAIKNHSSQLTTIGLGTASEVFKWDPGMLKLDFLSFHLYTENTNSLDDVKRQIKWIGETSKIPWVIGETGFSASDDPNLPGMGTTQFQKTFAKTTMEMTRDCGGAGYAWWQYADVGWGAPNSAFGVIDRHGNLKPVSSEFALFNPFSIGTTCVAPSNYLSIPSSGTTSISGMVIRTHLLNAIPVPNAVIFGSEIDANGEWINPTQAFTNASGNFTLYSNHPIEVIQIAAPGSIPKVIWSPSNNIGISIKQFTPTVDQSISGVTIPTTGYQVYEASNTVTASTLVVQGNGTSGGACDLHATNIVKLNPGFVAQKGAKVHVYNGVIYADCSYYSQQAMGTNDEIQIMKPDKLNPYDAPLSSSLTVENIESENIVISPNPNNGVFQISVNGDVNIEKITIINNMGQIAFVVNNPGSTSEIDISRFESGVYTVLIVSSSDVFKSKIIKN